MSIEEVKQGVLQGSTLFENLPVDEINNGWRDAGANLEAVKVKIYEAVGAIRGMQENLAGLLPPIGAISEGAEHGSQQLEIASEGTGNFDLLDVLASAELLVDANFRLGSSVSTMEKMSTDMVSALVGATLLLGRMVEIHEQVTREKLPETVTATPAQVVKYAAEYVDRH
jgi:hypothetical protein